MRRLVSLIALGLIISLVLPMTTPISVTATEVLIYPSKDNYLDEAHPDTNYGTDSFMHVGEEYEQEGTPLWCTGLVEFPINWGVDIPSGATIVTATFYMYYAGCGMEDPVGHDIYAQRVRRLDWSETTSDWYDYSGTSDWGLPGCSSTTTDYTTVGEASTQIPASVGWLTWDIVEQIEWAQTNDANVAIRLYIAGLGDNPNEFVSLRCREASSTTYDPYLLITYIPPPPTVTTSACTNPTSSSLDANGEVTDDGGYTITTRGFDYTTVYDDFEWGSDGDPLDNSDGLIDWTISAPGDSKVEIDTWQHYLGTRSARLYRDGEDTPQCYFSQTRISSDQAISFRFRTDSTSSSLRFDHGNGNKEVLIRTFSGDVKYYSDDYYDTGADIVANTWYILEVRNVDWDAGTYDIYLDGALIKGSTPMRVTSVATNVVVFYNQAGTTNIWLDEVAVWDVEDESGSFGEGTFSLTIEGLDRVTNYKVKAFAETSAGIGYGGIVTCQTLSEAPVVVTNDATYVGTTTARLNGYLDDDGGEACEYRFQYGLAPNTYDYETDWTGSITTGQSFYEDISGLSSDTPYYFRAQARNSVDTASGSEKSFTTEWLLQCPSNFDAHATSGSEISLAWIKGGGSDRTCIQMKTGTYPTSASDGTNVYLSISSSTVVEDLIPGTSYYFSAWGESGGNYSANYTQVMATTLAGVPVTTPTNPTEPTNWFLSPDCTKLANMPFGGQINSMFDAYSLPYATGWTLLALFLAALFGAGALLVSGGEIWVAITTIIAVVVFESFMSMIGLWFLLFIVIIGGSYAFLKRRPS